MKRFTSIILGIVFILVTAAAGNLTVMLWHGDAVSMTIAPPKAWLSAVNPGALSQPHAFLQDNCNACHTPATGVASENCIVCHANNESLLQQQSTAFHADIGNCQLCHQEHRGRNFRSREMNHDMFTSLGLQVLSTTTDPMSEERRQHFRITQWLQQATAIDNHNSISLSPATVALDCAACHSKDDRHFTLFGTDCADCHGLATWKEAIFQHPSPTSTDCAQCHQAPPSHYMMHFKMISQKVAKQPHARVDQCYACHQQSAWTDIKGVGTYKHH